MESKILHLISPIGQQLDGIANQGDGQGAWTKMKPKRRVSNTQIESKATICDAISAHMYNIYILVECVTLWGEHEQELMSAAKRREGASNYRTC